MAPPRTKDSSSWCYKHTISSSNRLLLSNNLNNGPIKLDKELLANKSAKIASLLKNNPIEDLSAFLQDIPSEPEALELVARFCHGLEVKMSSDNIIPLICLSHHLQMTETHCRDNLFDSALRFLKQNILPSWDQIIRSLRALRGPTFQQAAEIGLLNVFLEALSDHALSDPSLLAQPIMVACTNNTSSSSNNNNNNNNMPLKKITNNATRRKLFADHSSSSSSDSDASIEDLTSLPVRMYELIVEDMTQRQVPQENIAGSLYRYLKKHQGDKEALEAIERLLPTSTSNSKYPLYPYTLLFELHTLASALEASSECIASLENRIGMELYRATTEDLLALDLNVEGLRQILKGFYGNFSESHASGLVEVAELMEEYLLKTAKEKEVDVKSFTEVAKMASSTSSIRNYCCLDGIYRAVDAYLDKHNKELSELEREEVCSVLDFQKMSAQAVDHAALNRRLPMRVGLQVLLVSQWQLRDNISKVVGEFGGKCNVGEKKRAKEEINKVVNDEEWDNDDDDDDDDDYDENEEINEGAFHEKNCCANAKKKKKKKKKKKVSLWKGMKRKFGCMGSNSDYETLHDCNCRSTKKNKKKKGN